ncbi:MAG: hypothetical protein AVDCRST_MAG39-238, partial [uncultured Sphingomonadaceae bacterium]
GNGYGSRPRPRAGAGGARREELVPRTDQRGRQFRLVYLAACQPADAAVHRPRVRPRLVIVAVNGGADDPLRAHHLLALAPRDDRHYRGLCARRRAEIRQLDLTWVFQLRGRGAGLLRRPADRLSRDRQL